MELVLPGIPLVFEVTFSSPSLPVAMSVYDTTGLSPVLVQGPTAMENVVGNTYIGSFTGIDEKTYLIFKAVYIDDTFTVLDTDFSQGSESITVQSIGGGGGGGSNEGCQLIGVILANPKLVGIVEC